MGVTSNYIKFGYNYINNLKIELISNFIGLGNYTPVGYVCNKSNLIPTS